MKTVIALDAMGGDFGPSVTIPAAINALDNHQDLELLLVGQEEEVCAVLADSIDSEQAHLVSRLQVVPATQVVGMDEPPGQALRSKKDSSMRVAINLVKEGQAQACVSAGNTGALMATARFVLRTLPGIDRPAIITSFPTRQETLVRVLDLGANVDSEPKHLHQFALMGAVLTAALDGKNPSEVRIGLLNIGAEDIKGNDLVKQTAQLLSDDAALNYVGFTEGDSQFSGDVDVVVCDGFVGNVMLKTCEGVAKFIGDILKEEFQRNVLTKMASVPAMPVLKTLAKRVDPGRRNGATMLGLNGIVIKSHGGADSAAFTCAIDEACLEAKYNIPELIGKQIQQLMAREKDT